MSAERKGDAALVQGDGNGADCGAGRNVHAD
jgi:hypothetical protein